MEHKILFKDYNEALKENKLMGLKCKQCGKVTVPPKITCGECSSADVDVIQLSGKGEIQTFTTIFVSPEGREAETPYIIVMIQLDEGPWIMGNLAGVDAEKVTIDIIGKKVTMGNAVFPGDKFSAGDGARPIFSIES